MSTDMRPPVDGAALRAKLVEAGVLTPSGAPPVAPANAPPPRESADSHAPAPRQRVEAPLSDQEKGLVAELVAEIPASRHFVQVDIVRGRATTARVSVTGVGLIRPFYLHLRIGELDGLVAALTEVRARLNNERGGGAK